jgi:hypothetical protein
VTGAAGVTLLGVAKAFAEGLGPAIARPEGWIGTTAQWRLSRPGAHAEGDGQVKRSRPNE